ncbi:MAG: hypothetical protein ACLFWD_10010 [Anaerolineales bacterium]
MPFQLDIMLAALIVVVSIIAILLVAWRINVNRTLRDKPLHIPESLGEISDAVLEPGERIATPIGEQIEAMVQEELGEEGKYDVDFGRKPDGSLAVWVDGKKYADPAAIADDRVREAVARAVERFNKGTEAKG